MDTHYQDNLNQTPCYPWMQVPWEKKKDPPTTPQFTIKRSLGQGEFLRVVYANFSKLNILVKHKNTMCGRNSETIFVGVCSKWRHFLLVEISSARAILSKGRLLWKWILGSVPHFNIHIHIHLLSVIYSMIYSAFQK